MLNPDMAYRMATYDHQARIDAAARRREVREARAQRESGHGTHWFASVAARLRRLGRTGNDAVTTVVIRPSGQPTPA